MSLLERSGLKVILGACHYCGLCNVIRENSLVRHFCSLHEVVRAKESFTNNIIFL